MTAQNVLGDADHCVYTVCPATKALGTKATEERIGSTPRPVSPSQARPWAQEVIVMKGVDNRKPLPVSGLPDSGPDTREIVRMNDVGADLGQCAIQ